MRRVLRRPVTPLLSLVALTAALHAQGTPIGFEETWALAPDRAKAVATLIPGTDDWYYYHCRERLDARDFATVRRVLPAWIQRHGRNQRVVEIEHREALLSFGDDPARTWDFLRRRLALQFDHQPVVPGAVSDLPTRLDPELLAAGRLTQRALAASPDGLAGFTDAGLPGLVGLSLNPRQLRQLLERLQRPDLDNLPALVVRDLEQSSSAGFGSLRVHRLLRREQLEECVRLRPALLQDGRFVESYLVRLQPHADATWQDDPAARASQLQRLWEFAQRLPSAFNSLKAHVLFHWLQHDLTLGAPDKARFLAYVRLPRRGPHTAEQHLRRFPRGDEHVDLGWAGPTGLPAIGDDTGLLRACLERFFATEDAVEAYAEFLDASWLRGVLAETKILLGQGEMERWYSLLNDPARLEQLERRVEITFPPDQPTSFDADDPVSLAAEIKNVPTLLVKVFAIDAFRYHVETQRDVDASIELDGVVANVEQAHTYAEPPARRVRRTFDLPMLREPGTYVVELVGNGISSRAVVRKGGLRLVERTAAAGQALRVYDERGRHAADATAWFGGRDYPAGERGEILLPFSSDPGRKKLVLRAGSRTALVEFDHRAESYQLHGAVHVDREALVAGRSAHVVLRPQLRLADRDVALSLLTDRVLTIVATDVDGLATTLEVRDPALVDEREFVHEIRVPERLQSLRVSLRGRVKDLAGKDIELATPESRFEVNGIDATAETGVALLQRTAGGYVVELRGKNGELLAGRACALRFTHPHYTEPVDVALQTDDRGRIELGALPGIERVTVQRAGGTAGTFELRQRDCRLPAALHGRAGETLRLPYLGTATAPSRAELSLLGHERDAFDRLAVADGLLELRGLEPGDYLLQLHDRGAAIPVRITRGDRDGDWLVGQERILQASPASPLQLQGLEVDGSDLRIRLANATAATRVHVVATRFVPPFDLFAHLGGAPARAPQRIAAERPASSYHSGRKLGDEYRYVLERRFAPKYAGNMLARPSLLLNPWRLEDDTWNEAVGLGGGQGGRFGGRARRGGQAAAPEQKEGRPGAAPNPGAFANLDFLPEAAPQLCNLTPGADGVLRVPLARLGDGQHVHVLALDGDQAVFDSMVRPEVALTPRQRTLTQPLDPTQHFVEHRRIEFVAAGGTAVLEDARAAQVEVHDSLASVHRLFATITRDPDLARFAFVLTWPQRTPDEKLELYRQHACHELHFFLQQKDREFFTTVVQPLLSQKLDKTFLDHWLLGDDLTRFLEPWTFAQLNLIERVLLAHRLGGEARQAIARSVREGMELRPTTRERLQQLFELALRSEEMQRQQPELTRLRAMDPAAPGAPAHTGAAPPAAKAAAPDAGRADDKQDAERRKAGKDDAPAEVLDQAGGLVEREAELAERGRVQRLYRAVERTRPVVEHDWWHRRLEATTPDVVAPNRFWLDYATAPAGQPFVSSAVVEATGSFLEMMMALAVLDLPFSPGKHDITADGDRRTLRAATPLLLVKKEVTRTDPAGGPPLLLGQNLFRLDDRWRYEGSERRDAFVTDEFLVDVPYGCQVVVTNPTSSKRTAELLLQIPAGAVPLQKGFWTKGLAVELQPYATATVEYAFYFPAPGTFPHYPAHASEQQKLAAHAEARALRVVASPSKVDTGSWEHVSQQGSAADVLTFLDGHNVQRLDLSRLAWRMRDREFFRQTLQRLRARHAYDHTLWSYAVLHRDVDAAREYLRHADDLLADCGMALASPLVTIDPKERRRYQHIEFDPLVHPRAHRLGSQRVIGNAAVAAQYQALLTLLGYQPTLDADDWLAVTYHLALQDRIDEALAAFAKVDAAAVAAKVQYDYLAAWLCFFTGDSQRARPLAERHQDHPALHWRQRFRDILTQLDEAAGRRPAITDPATADPAALAPALELSITDRTVQVAYKNLTACEVRYYELDVEFAFSAQPFAGADGARAAYVQPNLREPRDLPAGQAQLTFPLPERFHQRNVLVEVRAGGLVRSRQYFANALDVRFLESFGQVAVTEPGGNQPLPKTYVKVFARLPDGTVRFHKDGYTDLRGRFDYASLSDDPNANAARYAVLVLDERRGAVIRDVAPPAK